MTPPPELLNLIDRFDHHVDDYRAGSINETEVRVMFIDPLFKLLGWDIDNTKGYADAYKDVIHEDAIKIGGVTKAPDYCFRVGGTRKFFLEAKKPSINLKQGREAIAAAYQVRRYAWTAKLHLSVLTDFEEMAIYDCRVRPHKLDKPAVARIKYYTYREFAEHWDEISGVFSRDAVLKGDFDRFVESKKVKKGSQEVDDAFLSEIETWRELLAKNIALRNETLTTRELNFAVQRTIDRLIFLRICEDRAIEPYGQLQGLLNGANIYKRLVEIFYRADQKYNSGLFHFGREKARPTTPDELTTQLSIDDKELKKILSRLYYPDSPYEFSVLPAEILGQVYEQFLGKQIRLTASHRAVVEEKPEVKKAGGVYYTPAYIVDYIVKNTVGKLVEGKKPKDVAKLRVLDPACGSGSFLIQAYQFLLDWHRDYYRDHGNQTEKKLIYEAMGGEWRLVTEERKRILLNNIYGVDIDSQAVEVTKLSLLLKVLEGETEQTLSKQLELLRKRVLPDLASNIKCGNSLIGPDFYDQQELDLSQEEIERINVFSWEDEFSEIMEGGKFDAVIGNPPYVRQESLGYLKAYFSTHFKVYHGIADLYAYFIERGVTLLREGGYFSYIVANKWLRANYGQPLRTWMKDQCIEEIVDFGDLPVFKKATTYPCILRIANKPAKNEFAVSKAKTLDFGSLEDYVRENLYKVVVDKLGEDGWSLARQEVQALLEKLKRTGVPLGEYVEGKIYRGILTGLNKAFVIDKETRDKLIEEDPKSEELIKPFLAGRDIKRYMPPKSDRYLIFTRRGVEIKKYPAILKHLNKFKKELMPKPKNWKGGTWAGRKPGNYEWYEIQDTIDYFLEFEKPKIIIPCIVSRASYQLDNDNYYSNDKTSIIPISDLYLLGLLNSKLLDFFMHSISSTKQGGYFEYKPMYVVQLPIKKIINSNDKSAKRKIESLVEKILEQYETFSQAKTDHERTMLQRQIDATDRQINRSVCELYGLTEEEIKIVEEAVK